jgi:hypothetical protein
LEACQACGDEAFTPLADGVAVASQFGGEVLIGGVVGLGGTQDDAAAKDQCLGRRVSADKRLKVHAHVRGQFDRGGEGAWHGCPPWLQPPDDSLDSVIAAHAPVGYTTGREFMKRSSRITASAVCHGGDVGRIS